MASRIEGATPPPRVWTRPLIWLLVIVLGLYALLFVSHAARLAFAPGELNYAEGVWFFSALRVRHDLPFYFDYSHPPYIAMVYPPLDPELAGIASAALSLSDGQVVPVARLLTLAAVLATVLAIIVFAKGLGVSTLPALLAALLFLTPSHTYALWSFVARSDMLAVALGLWGVTTLAVRREKWSIVAAGALCALALCAKQTAVAPLLACGWWLVTSPGKRRLLWFAVGFSAGLASSLGPLGFDGIVLLLGHTRDLAGEPWSGATFHARVEDLLSLSGPLVPVAMLGLVRVNGSAPGGLLARYVGLAVMVFLFSSGKVGSASSYCLELIASMCVLCGAGLQWLIELREVPARVVAGAVALVMLPLALQSLGAWFAVQDYSQPPADDRPLLAAISSTGGPCFSEDGYVVLHGTDPPYMLDPFYFSALARAGRWDPAPLVQMFSQKRFSSAVLTRPVDSPLVVQGISWEPPGVVSAISAQYVLSETLGRYYVYVRKH